MSRVRWLGIALPLVVGTVFAESSNANRLNCCGDVPRLIVGLDVGSYWIRTEEIVEALPEHAADDLSRLAWSAAGGVVGLSLSYRPRTVFRANGGFWFLTESELGKLVNTDYLDPSSDEVTHRSVSASDFHGAGWQLSLDFIVAESSQRGLFIRSFTRMGYRGNYHLWKARGGEYEYPDGRGRFDDNEEFVRYVVLHQVVDLGLFVAFGHLEDGFYMRAGTALSYFPWVDDRDTHFLRNTDYYNTYRWGWYVRPEVAVRIKLGDGIAAEVFYEPELQFSFADTTTRLKTPYTVRAVEEKPNYGMALHRVGIRLLWAVF